MIAPHPDDAWNYPIDMCWSRKGIKGRRASEGAHYRTPPRLPRKLHLDALSRAKRSNARRRAEATRTRKRIPALRPVVEFIDLFYRSADRSKERGATMRSINSALLPQEEGAGDGNYNEFTR